MDSKKNTFLGLILKYKDIFLVLVGIVVGVSNVWLNPFLTVFVVGLILLGYLLYVIFYRIPAKTQPNQKIFLFNSRKRNLAKIALSLLVISSLVAAIFLRPPKNHRIDGKLMIHIADFTTARQDSISIPLRNSIRAGLGSLKDSVDPKRIGKHIELEPEIIHVVVDSLSKKYRNYSGIIVTGDRDQANFTCQINLVNFKKADSIIRDKDNREFYIHNPDKIAFQASPQIEFLSNFILGLLNYQLHREKEAIGYFNKVLTNSDTLRNKELSFFTNFYIGNSYVYLNKPEQAYQYYKRADNSYLEIKDEFLSNNLVSCRRQLLISKLGINNYLVLDSLLANNDNIKVLDYSLSRFLELEDSVKTYQVLVSGLEQKIEELEIKGDSSLVLRSSLMETAEGYKKRMTALELELSHKYLAYDEIYRENKDLTSILTILKNENEKFRVILKEMQPINYAIVSYKDENGNTIILNSEGNYEHKSIGDIFVEVQLNYFFAITNLDHAASTRSLMITVRRDSIIVISILCHPSEADKFVFNANLDAPFRAGNYSVVVNMGLENSYPIARFTLN